MIGAQPSDSVSPPPPPPPRPAPEPFSVGRMAAITGIVLGAMVVRAWLKKYEKS